MTGILPAFIGISLSAIPLIYFLLRKKSKSIAISSLIFLSSGFIFQIFLNPDVLKSFAEEYKEVFKIPAVTILATAAGIFIGNLILREIDKMNKKKEVAYHTILKCRSYSLRLNTLLIYFYKYKERQDQINVSFIMELDKEYQQNCLKSIEQLVQLIIDEYSKNSFGEIVILSSNIVNFYANILDNLQYIMFRINEFLNKNQMRDEGVPQNQLVIVFTIIASLYCLEYELTQEYLALDESGDDSMFLMDSEKFVEEIKKIFGQQNLINTLINIEDLNENVKNDILKRIEPTFRSSEQKKR